MGSPMPANPLLANSSPPVPIPTAGRPPVPGLPAQSPPLNALASPTPGPTAPGVQQPQIHPDFQPQPVPEEERISLRVPVPKADFDEKHHKRLHEAVLGEHFDDPGAAASVRDIYALLRKTRPHIHPGHVLEAARDAWYAIHHGFMSPEMAGRMVGGEAHRRHVEAGGRHRLDDETAEDE